MSDTDKNQSWWDGFTSTSAEVGDWLWGTVEGAFNEKASFSQIIVDAVIGMIPVVGDVTAVRDLIATIVGLIDDPEKRESVWEWIMLVVFLLALIPVFGGVAKGVGRIVCKVFEDASRLARPARVEALTKAAHDVIKFLNRIGVGNAERWFKAFRLADHQAVIIEKFNAFADVLYRTLGHIKSAAGDMMPSALGERIDGLRTGLRQIKALGAKMIPKAIKELDQDLHELQAYIRTGGETTSRTVVHEVATGEENITYTKEAWLHEDGETTPKVSWMGQFPANADSDLRKIAKVYRHEDGYPDLLGYKPDGRYPNIAAFSGKIGNDSLAGRKISRLFGEQGKTLGVNVGESDAAGRWWNIGDAPKTPGEWRDPCAVLDEWNRDGFQVTAEIPGTTELKAATGRVAEQYSSKIPGQALPGGGEQAFIDVDKDMPIAKLNAIGKRVMQSGKPETWVDPETGIKYEFKKTPWSTEDVNGTIGYGEGGAPGQVSIEDLGEREIADKHYKGNAR